MKKLLFTALLLAFASSVVSAQPVQPWINELHYNQEGEDTGEFIEVAIDTSFKDLDRLAVLLVDGADGTIYRANALSQFSMGAIMHARRLYSFTFEYNDIKNGTHGLALCYDSNNNGEYDVLVESGGVDQFLSYGGTFTGASLQSCVGDVTSTDIGLAESDSTTVGSSLGLEGNGSSYTDFTWTTFETSSPGQPNSNQVLPVELTAFEGRVDGRELVLAWQTASEENNAGFHVQHYADGRFRDLAFVDGVGTTTEAQSYRHRLTGLAPGTHRFRLKQVDFDGASTYSHEVEVDLAPDGAYTLTGAAPNPFNPSTSFSLTVEREQDVRVAVYDVLGREVTVLHDGPIRPGERQSFRFQGDGLASGLYVYRAEGEHFTATRRMVLAR